MTVDDIVLDQLARQRAAEQARLEREGREWSAGVGTRVGQFVPHST